MSIRILAAAAVTAACVTSANAATFDGQTLTIEFFQNNSGTESVLNPQTGVVGTGVEASFFNVLDVDVSGDIISIIGTNPSSFSDILFNGWRIRDTNGTIDAFSDITLLPGNGFAGATASTTDDEILINFNKTGPFSAGEVAMFQVSFGQSVPAVPLPAGLPLMIGGLAVLGLARRRKRN